MTVDLSHLRFSQEHEWVLIIGENQVRVGISNYAQKQLGDIVFTEFPEVGTQVSANETMGTIESVKAVSELYSPVSGKVISVNTELEDTPETINEDPYTLGWLVDVELSNIHELESLMNEKEYLAFINEGDE
ncbi:glycine cleavage system protein GcvH [Metabacillus litoralis]|uniref:glycine cleavage system protein GcvH n=1 Tax=Metabacillus litoralis TaxID=152268 RepID=UPI00203D4EEE|nr:glycine cleavage system protein GcvH [Metabacillus litoralis]